MLCWKSLALLKKKKDLGKIFIAVLNIMPSFVYVTLSEAETIAAL